MHVVTACVSWLRSARKSTLGNNFLYIRRNLRRARERVYGESENSKYEELIRNLYPSQLAERQSNKTKDILSNNEIPKLKSNDTVPVFSSDNICDVVTPENQFSLLADRVTPLHSLPYDLQLKKKYKACLTDMRKFGKQFIENGGTLPEESHNSPCVVDPIIPSPVTEFYRNKDEFSIQYGVDGNPKTVGFFLDSPSENSRTVCVGADQLSIIRDSHKKMAQLFQQYIRLSSLPACLNFNEGGNWRNLIVRSNLRGHVMAVVILHPQELTKDQLQEEMEKFKEYVLQHKGDVDLKSLYFQASHHTRSTHKESPYQLLYGEPYIFEEIGGVKYRISPESFFQTNTLAAEVLYKVVRNACRPSKSTTILDICCGIGPVSFTLAPHVKQCIGIDTSAEAITDARINAKLNGFNNVRFHSGKCEHVLPDILNEIYSDELIAVINPGRSALGNNAIKLLRECKHLKKVVYVTCKLDAAIQNFLVLCQANIKEYRHLGVAFHPFRAVPLDLFPQTNHYEVLVLFQRI